MRCLHCGTSAGKKRPDELTTQEALDLIDELADLGCKELTLSGGEPLLREDWPQLAERIKEKGMTPLMVTNGYALNEKAVKELARIRFGTVGVSFDGTKKTHDHIRQREDSYERALGAMKLLIEAKIPMCAITQVSNMNLGDLDDIREDLINIGCKAWQVQMTTITGRMPRDLVLTTENFPGFVDKLIEFKKEDATIYVDVGENIGFFGCKGAEIIRDGLYLGCYAGVRVAGITSNGSVRGCLSMPEEFNEGNIRDGGFAAVWNKPDGFAYNRQFTHETATGHCRDCRYLRLCRGGCANTSIAATGERANNPYCVYQCEKAQGIEPIDSETTIAMMEKFPLPDEAASS
jgi:radical SAM protein with 4Fe4S-binding SPASM domain